MNKMPGRTPERRKRGTKLEAFPVEERVREAVIRHDEREVGNYQHLVMTCRDLEPEGERMGFTVAHARFFTKFGRTKVPSETPTGKWFEFREEALA